MNTPKVPFVRAAFVIQFKTAMLNNGVDADAYFKKWHIPFSRIESPDQLIPELPFWKLINDVAICEKIPDFGMQVAQITPWYKIEPLIPLIKESRNLGELLQSFCKATTSQSNVTSFILTQKLSNCHFSYNVTPLIQDDIQMELYRVTSMIDLIRYATGPNWKPKQLSLMMPVNKVVKEHSAYSDIQLCFGNEYSVVTFHAAELKRSLRAFRSRSKKTTRIIDDEIKFIESLRELVSLSITENACTIEIISELSGLSVRSLQRRLQANDLRFNDLVNEARFTHAKKMLAEPELQVTDIACQLGYSDPAHFTRAFRRWSGMSPSDYRLSYLS